jgi:hypothetical protein
MPPTLRIGPQIEFAPCNWVRGGGGDSGGPATNPVRVRRSPARGEQGSGLGPTRVRFVGSVGEEELPVGGSTGGRLRWPPRLPVPARWRLRGGGRYVGEL